MTTDHHLLSFPPSGERRVFGLFRPAHVLWLLSGMAIGLLAVTNLPLVSGLVCAALCMGAAVILCVVRVDGAPFDEVLFGLLWLLVSKLLGGRLTPSRHQQTHLVATVHHPDRFLADTEAQWQATAAFGEALASCAHTMNAQVQLLSIRRSLLGVAVSEQLLIDDSAHLFVTVVVVPAGESSTDNVHVLAQSLREAGALVGPVLQLKQPVVELGRVRRLRREYCQTSVGEIAVQSLRAGPDLPVLPTSLLDLFVDPPWDLFAVTVSPTSSASLQRRLERRQTAALADAELLERKGFRRSAAQDRSAERAAEFEASIARGERAVLAFIHSACVGTTTTSLATARGNLLSTAERSGVRFSSLSGRHHLGLALFGAPEVLSK